MPKLRSMMNCAPLTAWNQSELSSDSYSFKDIEPLFKKIEDSEIENQLNILKAASEIKEQVLEHKDEVEFDDFMKLEFRVVKIIAAEKVKKSKKLLKLTIDIAGERRTVVSGISQHYSPEDIVGKDVAMLLNLKPRKIMGIESQAMILAAKDDDKLAILVPERSIGSGSEIS